MASVISCTQTLKWCLTWKVERFKKTGFQGLKCLQKTECRKNWVEEIKVGNLCISVLSCSPLLLQCNYFWPVEQTPLIFSITSSCLLPPQPAVLVHLSGKPAIIGCIVKSFAALCQRTDSNKLGRKGWWVEEGRTKTERGGGGGKSSWEENNYREQTMSSSSDMCTGYLPSPGWMVLCSVCPLPSQVCFLLANPI